MPVYRQRKSIVHKRHPLGTGTPGVAHDQRCCPCGSTGCGCLPPGPTVVSTVTPGCELIFFSEIPVPDAVDPCTNLKACGPASADYYDPFTAIDNPGNWSYNDNGGMFVVNFFGRMEHALATTGGGVDLTVTDNTNYLALVPGLSSIQTTIGWQGGDSNQLMRITLPGAQEFIFTFQRIGIGGANDYSLRVEKAGSGIVYDVTTGSPAQNDAIAIAYNASKVCFLLNGAQIGEYQDSDIDNTQEPTVSFSSITEAPDEPPGWYCYFGPMCISSASGACYAMEAFPTGLQGSRLVLLWNDETEEPSNITLTVDNPPGTYTPEPDSSCSPWCMLFQDVNMQDLGLRSLAIGSCVGPPGTTECMFPSQCPVDYTNWYDEFDGATPDPRYSIQPANSMVLAGGRAQLISEGFGGSEFASFSVPVQVDVDQISTSYKYRYQVSTTFYPANLTGGPPNTWHMQLQMQLGTPFITATLIARYYNGTYVVQFNDSGSVTEIVLGPSPTSGDQVRMTYWLGGEYLTTFCIYINNVKVYEAVPPEIFFSTPGLTAFVEARSFDAQKPDVGFLFGEVENICGHHAVSTCCGGCGLMYRPENLDKLQWWQDDCTEIPTTGDFDINRSPVVCDDFRTPPGDEITCTADSEDYYITLVCTDTQSDDMCSWQMRVHRASDDVIVASAQASDYVCYEEQFSGSESFGLWFPTVTIPGCCDVTFRVGLPGVDPGTAVAIASGLDELPQGIINWLGQ